MADNMKSCQRCGKPFKASPADFTVNCPSCRRGPQPPKTRIYRPVQCGQCGHIHRSLRCDRCGF